MVNRLYNVAVLAAVFYCLAQVTIFAPTPERKFYLFAALGLIAFRYVVRLPARTGGHEGLHGRG